MKKIILLAFFGLLQANVFAQTNKASLKGLEKAFIAISTNVPELQQVATDNNLNDAKLELRKTGIKVANSAGDLTGNDAIFQITLDGKQNVFGWYLVFRLDVIQTTTLSRTSESLSVSTWSYTSLHNGSGSIGSSFNVKSVIKEAMNKLFDDYLSANGR